MALLGAGALVGAESVLLGPVPSGRPFGSPFMFPDLSLVIWRRDAGGIDTSLRK